MAAPVPFTHGNIKMEHHPVGCSCGNHDPSVQVVTTSRDSLIEYYQVFDKIYTLEQAADRLLLRMVGR